MKKSNVIKNIFNKNSLKAITLGLGTTFATTAPILNAGCNVFLPFDEEQKEENLNFITTCLGEENSGLKIYISASLGDGTFDENQKTRMGNIVSKYEKYNKNEVSNFEKSLVDYNTKNYFSSYLNGVKQIEYNAENIKNVDKIFEAIYNQSAYIYTDLEKSLETPEERTKFCYLFEAIAIESYHTGFDIGSAPSVNYRIKKETEITDKLEILCGMTNVKNDMHQNNCAEIVKEFKPLLKTAVANLNQTKGLNITEENALQLINITISANSIQSARNSLPIYYGYRFVDTTLNTAMEKSINSMEQNTEKTF